VDPQRRPLSVTEEWLRALPKAEVHVHLEGCIDRTVLTSALARTGVPKPEPAVPSFAGLADFLAYLDWSCAQLDRREDLFQLTYGLLRRARASGVRHVDALISPTHWTAWSSRLDELVDALDAGFRAGEADTGVSATLCLSAKRAWSAGQAEELVDWMVARRHPRLAGLSIDGNEAAAGRTGPRFAPVFARAAAAGLRRCVHAGESSGPEGVRDAIDLLGAERVDHGVRAVEDPALLGELAQRGIPLGVCPTSNVRLGLYPTLAAHPVDQLRQAGVRVTLNTDDPVLFETTVAGEYARAAATFGWDRPELVALARNSLHACFANPDRRRTLLGELDAMAASSL
jgi:adenosine deaminase